MNGSKEESLVGVPASEARQEESSAATTLVDRAKRGDAGAFDDLMRLYEGRIISIGLQMGLSRDDAMDACQDAFIKVFRYIGSFRSGESFFKWLHRIAINAVYDHMKHSRRAGTVSIEETEGASVALLRDESASPAELAEAADLARKVAGALDCLSRQERIVFVLRDLHDVATDQIGRILGLSQITVRRHCMSARQKLRDRLFD